MSKQLFLVCVLLVTFAFCSPIPSSSPAEDFTSEDLQLEGHFHVKRTLREVFSDNVSKDLELITNNVSAKAPGVSFDFLRTDEATDFLENIFNKAFEDHTLQMDCTSCKSLLISTGLLLKNIWEKEFLHWLGEYCNKTQPGIECQHVLDLYGDVIFDSIYHHYLDQDFLCGFVLTLCPTKMTMLNRTDYINKVLKDKPNTPLPTPTGKSTFKILHVTDIHLDPFYKEGAIVDCHDTVCCRKLPNKNTTSNARLSGYWGTLASCDLPLRTAEEMVKFIAKNVKVDMVVWTGDNSQHDIDKTSDQNINNTLLLSTLFKKNLPNIPVYPALGNHETYPVEIWNFKDNPKVYSKPAEKTYQKNQNQFESTFSTNWKDWIGADASKEFLKNGYFSSFNQQLKVRVISLNTNACHMDNYYLILDPTDPGDMLVWLEKTLAAAEKNKESVYMIGHVPPGSGDCYPEWSNRFSALVERYSAIIRGQFFGHQHSDSFFVYKSFLKKNETVNSGFLAPSMTTNSNRNPSFRVFEIDTDTKLPVNYYQYRLNLTKANLNPSQPLQWEVAYDFLGTYGYKNMSLASLDNMRTQILKGQTLYSTYARHYSTGNSNGPSKENLYCSSLSTIDQNEDCLTSLNVTVNPGMKSAGLQLLSGLWFSRNL